MQHFRILMLLMVAITLFSCDQEKGTDNDEAYDRLLAANQEQREESAEKDSTLNEMMRSFNEIYAGLREVRERGTGLKMADQDPELQNNSEEEIMNELKVIDELMIANKQKIAELQKNMAGSDLQISELTEMINNLNLMLDERDEEIAHLEDELMSTSRTLGTLIQMYRDQSQLVEYQEDALNTAYYIVGTVKQLKEQGVLSKEGGVAGIGGKKKLSGDVDTDAFKKIDISKETEIILKAKDPNILSSHPTDSYDWAEDGDRLIITDPELFWSISKYLVISVSN